MGQVLAVKTDLIRDHLKIELCQKRRNYFVGGGGEGIGIDIISISSFIIFLASQ